MTPIEQQAYDTLLVANKWIEEAKPLLARGGETERENASLRARCERLEGVLDNAAATLEDAARTFRLFQKPVAAEAMTIAARATREALAQPEDVR